MTRARKVLGRTGEALAARHLSGLGYEVIDRNVRLKAGEIDIVARDGPVLVFVEVRTRRGDSYGTALESIDERKRRTLARLALAYVQASGLTDANCRFDVVTVTYSPGSSVPRIDHIKGAFDA